MATDPIANFITALSNAARVRKDIVRVPYSKMKHAIADVLEAERYIKTSVKKGKKTSKYLEVSVVYDEGGLPHLHNVKRISKPSKRVYYGASDIKPVRNGFGMIILSTPKGIMTGMSARKHSVGGEALFTIW